MHFVRERKKMVLKTWEIFYKFHHLTGLFLVSLVAAALYLTQDINYWNIVKKQVNFNEEQTTHNESSTVCDYFSGKWVYDNTSNWPLYKERQCSFMEDDFACEKYGRKDFKYLHWRWQPHHCDIPRFNGTALLEKIRGKRLVFVGDSINRNQWISLLCLIESSLPQSSNKSLILKGNLYHFHDIEYNATIGFYWSPYLVESNCDEALHHRYKKRVVRVESIEKHAKDWNDADILIFDSYAWWLDPTIKILLGSFGSSDAIYKTREILKLRPYEMGLATWSDWLEMNINRTKTKLFFMSVSPYMFRDDISRRCYNISDPIFEDGYWNSTNHIMKMKSVAETTIEKLERRGVKVEFLPITQMSAYRGDAHPSIYRKFDTPLTKENKKDQTWHIDCLHWCLPGVPDVWNQVLYAYIMK